MTGLDHVFRIRRTDSDGDFVFLNVSSNGPASLDLRLLATEGESPYATEIKSSRISKLREKKSVQNDSQWEHTLLTTLLRRLDPMNTPEQSPDETIETVASIADSRLTLIFRKNISGITQRLGEITLYQDDNLELDTLSWTSTAIERGNMLEAQFVDLTLKHSSAQQTISRLNQQLEDLIAAKQAHEAVLLAKFMELLNAKKLKIRDQQRLLAGAKVDREKGRRVQAASGTTNADTGTVAAAATAGREPGESRKGKRKAAAAVGEHGDEDSGEEEAAFEGPSSLARIKDENEDEEADGMLQTPDPSEGDVTEDEDEGEGEGGKTEVDAPGSQRMLVDTSPSPTRDLPPDRVLPFGDSAKKGKGEKVQKQQQEEEDQESEDDDDDEL